jgi:DNA-binding beta-propeller fold protein YncE
MSAGFSVKLAHLTGILLGALLVPLSGAIVGAQESDPVPMLEPSELLPAPGTGDPVFTDLDSDLAVPEIEQRQEFQSPETQSSETQSPQPDDSRLQSLQRIPLNSSADRIDRVPAPEQQLVVVGLLEEQVVELIDVESGDPVWRTPVGFAPSVVRVDPVRLRVYVSGPNAPGIIALDLSTGALQQAYGLPGGALDLELDLDSGRLFAPLPRAGSVTVITPGQSEARELPMPSAPLSLVFDPQRQQLIVGLSTEDPLSLLVVNPENGELLARWRGGRLPEMLALDVDRQQLVALNSGSQDLSVVDLNSNGQKVESIGLDWRPTRLVIVGSRAYVTARDSNRLQVVDLDSLRLETTYGLGSQPTGILSFPSVEGAGLLLVEAGIPQLHWIELPPPVAVTMTRPENGIQIGAITGRIRDIAGQEVTTGTLTIAPTGSFSGRQEVIEPDGSFLISDLPAGIHLLDVMVPGFAPTSVQVQVRAGFVSTQDVQLPPVGVSEEATGIGILPDLPTYSDELARHLSTALAELEPERKVLLLSGPLGPVDVFRDLAPLAQDLVLLDRDERYTNDLQRLQVIGGALGLRYVILTQLQITQGYDRRGSALLNTAVRFLAPVVPVDIPNFTPNQLRSRGLVVVVDLHTDKPGDQARYYEAYGRDDVGGQPMFDDAAAGLFRLQVRNMIPVFMDQLRNANPFGDPPA